MAVIKKIKIPGETLPRDIGVNSSNVVYDGDSGTTTTLNSKIQSIFTAIGDINSFEIALVNALPTENIDDHTIYFVPNSQDANTRDEYMYVGNQWELIGSTTIDLSDYPTYDDISIVQGLTIGIPAATITVGATTTTLYAPTPTAVTITQGITTGITIGSIDVNGTTTTFYAPESKDPVYYVEIAVEDDPENEGELIASFVNDDTFESISERIENGEDVKAKINNNSFMNLNIEESSDFISFTSVGNFNSGEISINTIDIDTNNIVYAYTDHVGDYIKLYEASYNDKTGTFSIPFIRYSNIIEDLQTGKAVYINLTCVAIGSGDQEETNILYKCEGTHYGGFSGDNNLIFTHQRGNGIVDYIIFPSDNSSPYMGQYDPRIYVDSQISAITSTIPSITATAGLTTGVTIGAIDINGVTTILYAPEDTKVKQNDITGSTTVTGYFPVLFSDTTRETTNTIISEAQKTSRFYYNTNLGLFVVQGNGTDNNGGFYVKGDSHNYVTFIINKVGTTSTAGIGVAQLGNQYAVGTEDNSQGTLIIYGEGERGNKLYTLDSGSGNIPGKSRKQYNNYLPMTDGVLAAGVTTGVGSSTVPVYMAAGGELLACTLPTPSSYSLSMTGATITLLADNIAASTITLPIYDGTVTLTDAGVVG